MFELIGSLLHIVLAVIAIVGIVRSTASGLAKVLWSLFVLCFPIIGFLVWLIAGPKNDAVYAT